MPIRIERIEDRPGFFKTTWKQMANNRVFWVGIGAWSAVIIYWIGWLTAYFFKW